MSGDEGDERLARAALTRVAEPRDAELGRRVRAEGAAAVLAAIAAGTLPSARLEHYRTRLGSVDPAEDLAAAARLGARLVCPGDLEWPTQLDDLGDEAPYALWVRGAADLRWWALRSVAVVGARACTHYGEYVAGGIASSLAERGWTVVSGAAYGIDAAAHRGALAGDGPTVAVLACGVDTVYPLGNATLLARVADEGLVVSELAPGTRVTKSRFLDRNRLIAALTRGVVVVEAAARSGALNTARHARDLARTVMAVPGPVTSALSQGCHELVRVANASLVTDAGDVLDLVGALGEDAAPLRRGEERPLDALGGDVLRVFEALPARRAAGVDRLVQLAGLPATTLLACLGELAELGLAECRSGGWRLTEPARAIASPSGSPHGGEEGRGAGA